ncbi:MAG: PKD domain-containing protein [Pirellulales bacterium]|nr:PKD domain-containing protein [Pirellulales bacterium]
MFSVPFLSSRKTSSSRRNRRSGRSRTAFEPRRIRVEALEDRRLLSVVPDWVLGAGGLQTDGSSAVATDTAGNVYVTGNFQGEADFDGDGISDAHGNSLNSLYLAKYAPNGDFEWVRVGNALKNVFGAGAEGQDVAVDADGNVYVLGNFYPSLDFNGDMASDLKTTYASNFVVKYSPDGNYLWSTSAPVLKQVDKGYGGIAVDDNGDRGSWSAYITGYSAEDSQIGISTGYVAKLSAANGQMAWKRLWGSLTIDSSSYVSDVDVDELGSVYVTGTFVDGFDVTNDGTVDVMKPGRHAFVIKYSSVGDVLWWTSLDVVSTGNNLDLPDGSVYIAGSYGVTKLDAGAGTVLWTQPIGAYNYSADIAVAADGTAYLAGTFGGTCDLDGDGATDLISAGSADAFLAALDSEGHLLNAWGMGGVGDDRGYGVATDGAGNVYLTGWFGSTAAFPTGSVLESRGSYDIFLLRMAAADPNNAPPVADPGGPYDGVEDVPVVTFDASASTDPDGDPLTYLWNFGDGSTATGIAPQHTYLWGGEFTVTLTVDDGKGGSNAAITTATITEVNDAPVANPGGPYSALVSQPITFDGSASYDYDNQDGTSANEQTLTYTWDFGDGATGSGETASHAYAAVGDYTATLTVSDGVAASTATVMVSVTETPVIVQYDSTDTPKPIADASPKTGPGITQSYITPDGTVHAMAVEVTLTHESVGQLAVYLISPTGDEARLTPVVSGPTVRYENLGFADAETGTWTLKIVDSTKGKTGTLQGWSLFVQPVTGTMTSISTTLSSDSADASSDDLLAILAADQTAREQGQSRAGKKTGELADVALLELQWQ